MAITPRILVDTAIVTAPAAVGSPPHRTPDRDERASSAPDAQFLPAIPRIVTGPSGSVLTMTFKSVLLDPVGGSLCK